MGQGLKDRLRLGLVQMTSSNRHEDNIAFAADMIAQGAAQDCQMVAFPEVAGMMNKRLTHEPGLVGPEETDPFIGACRSLAKKNELWIHTGSTPIAQSDDARFLNHSNLINPNGEVRARYDKVHLFDLYPQDRPPMLESKRYAPGNRAVLADTPWGGLGMSICYDLRFPHLYRQYAKAGATMLFIPSAFTVPTGQAHWEVLLRARAIENGAFVVASAQVGTHADGRVTYGHAMVVDPWGKVLVDMGTGVGLAVVDLDLSLVASSRAHIPSLTHDQQVHLD